MSPTASVRIILAVALLIALGIIIGDIAVSNDEEDDVVVVGDTPSDIISLLLSLLPLLPLTTVDGFSNKRIETIKLFIFFIPILLIIQCCHRLTTEPFYTILLYKQYAYGLRRVTSTTPLQLQLC